MFYCSRDCQCIGRPFHQTICCDIVTLERELAELKPQIRHHVCGTSSVVDLFREAAGAPDATTSMQVHIHKKTQLKHLLHVVAQGSLFPSRKLWERVCHEQLELLGLGGKLVDNTRQNFPLLLLNLGPSRYDDVYSFVLAQEDGGKENVIVGDTNAGREGGDPKQSGCRYRNILQDLSLSQQTQVGLGALVAVLIMKLRLVADFEHAPTKDSKKAHMIASIISVQIPSLIQHIHQRNPLMLPSLLYPDALLSHDPPRYFTPGSQEEAYTVCWDAIGPFQRTPGARETLLQALGTDKPTIPTLQVQNDMLVG